MSPTKSKTKKPAAKAAKKPAAKKPAAKKPAAKKAAEPKESAPPVMKHGEICHLEFAAPDIDAAGKLYSELFGWQVHPFMPTEKYFQTTGMMGGCILQGEPAADGKTVFYAKVDDIAATIAKAEGLGASVATPKTEIPGGHGYFAIIKMPEGNRVGLWNRH